jgi:hypothetical protein
VLRLHGLERAGEGGEILRGRLEAAPDTDQRNGHDRDDHDGEQDAEENEQVRVAHDSPYPSVRAFI